MKILPAMLLIGFLLGLWALIRLLRSGDGYDEARKERRLPLQSRYGGLPSQYSGNSASDGSGGFIVGAMIGSALSSNDCDSSHGGGDSCGGGE